MRKIYLSFLSVCAAVSLNAQYDIEVNLVSPTEGATVVAEDGFEIDFSVSNNGPDDIPQGDVLFLAVLTVTASGQDNYGLDNNPAGTVSTLTLPVAFESGQTITTAQLGGAAVNDLVTNMNGPGSVCMYVVNGETAFTSGDDPNEVTMDNNSSCFQVNEFASIDEIQAFNDATDIQVLPDAVSVSNTSNESISYTVVSLTGQIVDSGSFNSEVSIPTEDFNNGIYIINVSNGNGSKSVKFAVSK